MIRYATSSEFTEGVLLSRRIARAGEFLAADILLQFDPLMADRTGKDKQGTGDTDDPRWKGEELISWGKQTFRVKVGDILVIRLRDESYHLATFRGVGAKGEVWVYDHFRERNEENPKHEKRDIPAPKVNGQSNRYSPQEGAFVVGIHRASSVVSLKTLDEAAAELEMLYRYDGSQCYNYAQKLADRAGYTLISPLSQDELIAESSGFITR